MKKSELLQAAIDNHLWDGNPDTQYSPHLDKWLCMCVEKYFKNDATVKEIREIIRKRIYPYLTIDDWLKYAAKIPDSDLTYENIQAYRKRWAESLIEEFKAAGD